MKKLTSLLLALTLTQSLLASDKMRGGKNTEAAPAMEGHLETLDTPKEGAKRYLASSTKEEDIAHYQGLDRRLGVDIGMFIPMGDFQAEFQSAPLIGLHFIWEAIAPWAFTISTHRASTTSKQGAAFGKLTTSNIAIGTQATFASGRFLPYIKLQGSFDFNDVSFDTTKIITAGNDTFLTTVGIEIGLGWDFIVGREISFGLEGIYHYSVPKKVTLNTGTMYDLGSSYATAAFRINF